MYDFSKLYIDSNLYFSSEFYSSTSIFFYATRCSLRVIIAFDNSIKTKGTSYPLNSFSRTPFTIDQSLAFPSRSSCVILAFNIRLLLNNCNLSISKILRFIQTYITLSIAICTSYIYGPSKISKTRSNVCSIYSSNDTL